jgi:hypothetical protein
MRSFDLDKLWTDITESAKEVAGQGLALGSRALDLAATKLKNAEARLRQEADKSGAGDSEPPTGNI